MIDEGMKEATASTMAKRMAAIVHRRGDIISKGRNRPLLSPWKRVLTPFSIHAEADALLDVLAFGCEMTVVRVRKDGSYGTSKPCAACMGVIVRRGIRRVHYFEDDSWKTLELQP